MRGVTGFPNVEMGINPPTDRPFETIQKSPFQKCPLVFYTHGDTISTVLVASCTTIQMVLEGPLIYHLEVSEKGFVLAVLQYHLKISRQGFVLADLQFKTI